MAQVVIFAPKGEDVSAGEQALKDAGHDVEVLEATPAILLHMALGMIEGDEEAPAEEPAPEEEPPAEEPAPEEGAGEEEPPAEEPAKEGIHPIGRVLVDGEVIDAYIGKQTALFGKVASRSNGGLNYFIGESQFTAHEGKALVSVSSDYKTIVGAVRVKAAASTAFIVLSPAEASALGLV